MGLTRDHHRAGASLTDEKLPHILVEVRLGNFPGRKSRPRNLRKRSNRPLAQEHALPNCRVMRHWLIGRSVNLASLHQEMLKTASLEAPFFICSSIH